LWIAIVFLHIILFYFFMIFSTNPWQRVSIPQACGIAWPWHLVIQLETLSNSLWKHDTIIIHTNLKNLFTFMNLSSSYSLVYVILFIWHASFFFIIEKTAISMLNVGLYFCLSVLLFMNKTLKDVTKLW
jgi:hypothetical protein